MRDISINTNLNIYGNEIIPSFRAHFDLMGTIKIWDLNQITSILTVDSLKNDELRKKEIHRRRKRSNILLGAVVGGLMDASEGDDSILDGVLIGAAFGAIATGSPSDPRAQIGILFQDGGTLSLDVSKEEYTLLQTAYAKAQEHPVEV